MYRVLILFVKSTNHNNQHQQHVCLHCVLTTYYSLELDSRVLLFGFFKNMVKTNASMQHDNMCLLLANAFFVLRRAAWGLIKAVISQFVRPTTYLTCILENYLLFVWMVSACQSFVVFVFPGEPHHVQIILDYVGRATSVMGFTRPHDKRRFMCGLKRFELVLNVCQTY